MKEFWKSVDIWRSYGQEFGVLFFDSHDVLVNVSYRFAAFSVRSAYNDVPATSAAAASALSASQSFYLPDNEKVM